MATQKFVGRAPNNDASVVSKGYIDGRYETVKVTTAYVSGAVSDYATANTLVTQSYIDTADATRAKKTAVDAADTLYLPTSVRGVAGGVASLNASTQIPGAQLPTLITDSPLTWVDAQQVYLTELTGVYSSTAKTLKAATLSVADPGYPYQIIPLGSVTGYNPNLAAPQTAPSWGNTANQWAGSTTSFTLSFNVTTPNTYLVFDVVVDRNVTFTDPIRFNGYEMTLLSSTQFTSDPTKGRVMRYGLAYPGTGTYNFTGTFSAGALAFLVPMALLNVGVVKTTITTTGNSTVASQGPIACPTDSIVLQSFAHSNDGIGGFSSPTGGTNRYIYGYYTGICENTSTAASTTFKVNNPSPRNWAAMATVFSPVPYGIGRGKAVVIDSSDKLYAGGATTFASTSSLFPIMPTAVQGTTPSVINGPLSLDMWLSLQSGTGYVFDPAGFRFSAMVAPAG